MNRPAIYKLLLRTLALVLHLALNVTILTWVTDYDISSSWLITILFVAMILVLAALFIYHLIYFLQFIKTRT